MMTEKAVKSPSKPSIVNWQKICRVMLEHTLPILPFTSHPDESDPEGEDIPLFLEGIEGQRYTQEQLFTHLRSRDAIEASQQPVAIVGMSGSGKTTLLHQIALWILEKTEDLPIWISPLEKLSPRQYLLEQWLPQAEKVQSLPAINWPEAFEELLDSGRVWLLIDGVEGLAGDRGGFRLDAGIERTRILLAQRAGLLDRPPSDRFEVYRFLPLSHPAEVKQFILGWFARRQTRYGLRTGRQDERSLAGHLWENLARFGYGRLRDCCETPLRLSLLCRLWQECQPDLPTTRSSLYRQLIHQFYRWQAENTPTTGEEQQKLGKLLGKLALQARQSDPRLSHAQVVAVFAQDPALLPLALQLGWLTTTHETNPREPIYAFSDEAFQDYFAALTIEDWRFFLPEFSPKSLELPGHYPVFEERWQRVILFWLGDENIAPANKNAFLQALTTFEDRCSPGNLYGKRAYCLAVAGLAEFKHYDRAAKMIQQTIRWGFLDKTLPPPLVEFARNALRESDRTLVIDALIDRLPSEEESQKAIFRTLEKIASGHDRAIAALSHLLETAPNTPFKWQLAESLGKIQPNHPLALQTLIKLLETSTDDELRQLALSSLERLGKVEAKGIAALVRLLQVGIPTLTRRTFTCLETIGQGNATAIAALVQLIRTTRDSQIHCQAAESLEKIDPGNPTAITVLVQLLQTATNEEIRQQAVYSLGEITPGNAPAINALVNLLSTSGEIYTHWLALSSLGKIGGDSPQAIEALVKLIQTTDQPLLRKDSIDSLIKIAPDHPVGISALVAILESTEDESSRREAAETLGGIDPGNPEAIAALSTFLQGARDEFTRRQVAASLGKIDPGNLEAILALVQLLQSSKDSDIRGLAAESLGDIGLGNPAAIATLIRCLEREREPKVLKLAAKSLGQIGRGHREAIGGLLHLSRSNADNPTRLQAIESLIRIVPESRMGEIVSYLAEFLPYTQKKGHDSTDTVNQQLLWKCARSLSYPDFYRAWHEPNRKAYSIVPPKDDFSTHLRELSRNLPDDTHLLYIDSAHLLDIEHPVIDIYDQMLAQDCRPFEQGIPETFSKLRLYWNNLRRNQANIHFIWVFYENPLQSQGFSDDFLSALSKFAGEICLVTEREIDFPLIFSPKNPRSMLQWIQKNL